VQCQQIKPSAEQQKKGTNIMNRRTAFRLIDLALLAGLIVIIGMMLLPALARPHYPARKMKCKNNLRQLGTGMIQYID
jgi:hypothetical protein